MGNEYAPDAIRWLANQIVDSVDTAEISGIVGDVAHTYGYHRSRNVIPRNDYSAVLAADRRGDGDAASALDMKYSAKWMRIVTARLIKSAEDPGDPRMAGVREFYGTTNGAVVNGRIHNGNYEWRFESSDDSHLWHVHISFLREHANNKQTMRNVLSVITNEGQDDMEQTEKIAHSATTKQVPYWKGEESKTVAGWLRSGAYQAAMGRLEQSAQFAGFMAAVDKLDDKPQATKAELREAARSGAAEALAHVKLTWDTGDE